MTSPTTILALALHDLQDDLAFQQRADTGLLRGLGLLEVERRGQGRPRRPPGLCRRCGVAERQRCGRYCVPCSRQAVLEAKRAWRERQQAAQSQS